MGSIFGPIVSSIMMLIMIFIVLLYVVSVLWTLRDAKARGVSNKAYKWLSIIPFAGVLAYILLRPPLLKIDQEEQEIDIALKRRQLSYYGNCSKCGYPINEDYIVCPNCEKILRDVCDNCGSSLDFSWSACPYCGTKNLKNQPFSEEPDLLEHTTKKTIDK